MIDAKEKKFVIFFFFLILIHSNIRRFITSINTIITFITFFFNVYFFNVIFQFVAKNIKKNIL